MKPFRLNQTEIMKTKQQVTQLCPLAALVLSVTPLPLAAQPWATNNLPSGCVAWWQAESNALDIVGQHAGSLAGDTAFAPAHVGNGFIFDGTNDSVSIPHDTALNVPSTGFTVEFWMKAGKDQPETIASIVDKDHSAADSTGWEVSCWRDTGRLSFGIGDGSTFPLCTNLTDVLDNQFHHVAFAWDRTNWLIHVDGVLENSLYRPTVVNNARPLRFGYHWGDGSGTPMRFFKGVLDEVRIYQRALSAAEIVWLAGDVETIRLVATQNAQIDAGAPDTPFQDWGVMDVFSCRPSDTRRVLLQFDLSAIPAGAVLTSAKLGICSRAAQDYAYSQAQEVWRVENDAWNQSTVTWNNYVSGPSNYLAVLPGGIGQHYSLWDLDLNAWNPADDLADDKLSVVVKYPADVEGDYFYRGTGYYSRAVPNPNNLSGLPDADIVPYLEITYAGDPPVIPQPLLQVSAQTTNQLKLMWNTFPGWSYQLQANTALETTNWLPVTATNYASELSMTNSMVAGTNSQRFFRVQQFSR